MLFHLFRGASNTVFGQYLKNNACNSWITLIDVRSQCKVYLGMNEQGRRKHSGQSGHGLTNNFDQMWVLPTDMGVVHTCASTINRNCS